MSKSTVADLIQKYLDDSITPDDFSRLYELINNEYDPEALESVLKRSFSDPSFSDGSRDYDLKEVFASLQARIREREAGKVLPLPAPVIPLHRRRWIAVAAAVILLLGVGTYIRMRHEVKPNMAPANASKKQDVPPGHDGAILTLADGRQIVLDSVQNGSLAMQGTTRITKLNNGQLNYSSLTGKPSEILYNTLTTPRARKATVILADGTQVWLNAASSIKYPTVFSGKERRVEIAGEAYFEIKKNAGMPFFVKRAGSDQTIQVLGTRFNVNAYDDEDAMKTTLLEGSVKVIRGRSSSVLSPGQQAILGNRNDDGIRVVDDANIDEVMAWKNGRFQFSNMDLKTIMRQLTRWYDVDVVFEGKVPDIRVGGFIHKDVNLSIVMEFLGENGVHYKIDGKKITIL
jgi:ferric-dicitrate binding protein FerR (iron transport regulator)